jgi:hypothetical protein
VAELSGLTLTVIKFGFLAVLWVFVLTAVSVMRSDLFGTRVSSRGSAAAPPARGAARPAKQPKPARPRRGTPSVLVVTAGSLAGTSIRLGDAPVVIGRSNDCTLVIDDDYASSRHAQLLPRDGTWYVEDLGSTNGTYLDRQKVSAPMPAPLGVPIRVGKTVVELRK